MDEEARVLEDQLDELLEEGAIDGSDALEIAVVAGTLHRLAPASPALGAAVHWRSDATDLLDEGWDEVEPDELMDALDTVLARAHAEEELEDVLYDCDELIAAAIWCGRTALVRDLAVQLADRIRGAPEAFAPLADVGSRLARTPAIAERPGLYDYWLAVADAAQAIPSH